MFKKKRILSFILILIFTMSIMTACNQDKGNSKSDESGEVTVDEKKKLVIGTSGAYIPWAFKEGDELKGFEIDVWEEIAERNNYELDYKLAKFSGLMGMLSSGQIDSVAHQMSITEEREEMYDFSEPYAYSFYDFVVKKDSDIKTLDDLKGKTVGCWLGGNGEATLRQVNEEHNLDLDIKTYDGSPLEIEVDLGRIDALWQGEVKTKTIIEQENLDLEFLNQRLAFEVNAYPFNKEEADEKVIEDISQAIKDMREDGTLSKLSEKWFGLDTTNKPE